MAENSFVLHALLANQYKVLPIFAVVTQTFLKVTSDLIIQSTLDEWEALQDVTGFA